MEIKKLSDITKQVDEDFDKQSKRINELEKNLLEFVKNWERQETELRKYPLYNKILKELELKENELKEIKTQFNKLHKTINEIDLPKTKQPKINNYSLACDYSVFKIKTMLFPLFKTLFVCEEIEIINLLSENITTQIKAKHDTKLKQIVYFFDWLKDENHFKARNYTSIIANSKCIIWNNSTITSQQIKDARKDYKKSGIDEKTELFLGKNR